VLGRWLIESSAIGDLRSAEDDLIRVEELAFVTDRAKAALRTATDPRASSDGVEDEGTRGRARDARMLSPHANALTMLFVSHGCEHVCAADTPAECRPALLEHQQTTAAWLVAITAKTEVGNVASRNDRRATNGLARTVGRAFRPL